MAERWWAIGLEVTAPVETLETATLTALKALNLEVKVGTDRGRLEDQGPGSVQRYRHRAGSADAADGAHTSRRNRRPGSRRPGDSRRDRDGDGPRDGRPDPPGTARRPLTA